MVAATKAANRLATANANGNGGSPVPQTEQLFSADTVKFLRQMRVNPLPMLNPGTLGITLDQFDAGMLRQAALLWEAMTRRDDTLITVKTQLENAVASKDWGVFPVQGADREEAARHKAALDYFYDHVRATDAFDRNERGGRDKLIEQMMRADSFFYAVHHFVWKPQPGRQLPVSIKDEKGNEKQLKPVPALTAELEYVPLWFFENTTGRLRFLPDGGFGIDGKELDWDGEWMCTAGRGLMFAASICYTFKRLTFQDWTIFNERYAQNKVVGQTPAAKNSEQGNAMHAVVANFNSDQGIVLYESSTPGDKPPITLLGPQGTATVEIFEKFIERQDRKMASMYRGSDLSMMSRGEQGEQPIGASLQGGEGEAMERGACRRIAGACQEGIDRAVIRFCFGEGVEPLAYFGLPDMDVEDTKDLRESAGFLADRGAKVVIADIAERLGVQLAIGAGEEEDILQPAKIGIAPGEETLNGPERTSNVNRQSGSDRDLEKFLGDHRDAFLKALANDLQPLRAAIEHVVESPIEELQRQNILALRGQLPWILEQITRNPESASELATILAAAFRRGAKEGARA
jgi:phage gp29-like protein